MACSPRALFSGRRAGDVQTGVGRGQIEARIHQVGIEILARLEILNGGVRLASLEGRNALVQEVAGLELVARPKRRDNEAKNVRDCDATLPEKATPSRRLYELMHKSSKHPSLLGFNPPCEGPIYTI